MQDDHDEGGNDIESGDHANEEEDDEHDTFFHLDGAEEGGVLVHPCFDRVVGAEDFLEAVADEWGVIYVIEADFQGVDAGAKAVELLAGFQSDNTEVRVVIVVAGVKKAGDSEFLVHGNERGARWRTDAGSGGELNFVAEAEAHLFRDLVTDDNLVVGEIEGADGNETL